METRWKHKQCGYNLTKEEIKANIKEGSLDKPSSLVICCPDCIQAVSWFDLVSFIHDGNNSGPKISNIKKEEKKKKRIEVLRKENFKFKRKDLTKFGGR